MEIVSPGITTQGSNNTPLTANPANKYIYFAFRCRITPRRKPFANSTNIAALNAWMFGQARTTDAITISKINPQVRGTSVHEAQRDTRARVLSIADARPNFTFIR